jgi:hypothetical protein
MGTWELQPEVWSCPSCGKSNVVEHCEEQCCAGEHKGCPGAWTTRKDREANPSLSPCPIQHLLWSPDHTWMTCECGRDLPDDEVAKVLAHMRTIDWSKMAIHEKIGTVIINDYAIAMVQVEADKTATEPEFVGKMPVRQDVCVSPRE